MGRLIGLALVSVLALTWTLGCSRPEQHTGGTAATPILPTPNLIVPVDDEEAEIADAFEAEVQQIVDQAKLLAGASCDRLVLATEQDPTSLSTLRSFALTLKDLAAREDALARSSTQSLVRVMEQSLTALDQTLVSCKIDTRPSEAQFAEYDWV